MRPMPRRQGWKDFLLKLKEAYVHDQVSRLAGAVTFFAVLALFPFLLFTLALASVLIDLTTAEAWIQELTELAPGPGTELVSERLRVLGAQNNVGLLTLSAIGAFLSASVGVRALISALNGIHRVEETRPFWKVRAIALGATALASVMSLVAGLLAVMTPVLAQQLGGPLATLLLWLRLPVSALLLVGLWGVLYYLLPNVRQRLTFFSPGAVTGVTLWVALSALFSAYVARFGQYDAAYGTLGGIIVLLLWIWLSNQALLVGAAINVVLQRSAPARPNLGTLASTPARKKWRESLLGLWMAWRLNRRIR